MKKLYPLAVLLASTLFASGQHSFNDLWQSAEESLVYEEYEYALNCYAEILQNPDAINSKEDIEIYLSAGSNTVMLFDYLQEPEKALETYAFVEKLSRKWYGSVTPFLMKINEGTLQNSAHSIPLKAPYSHFSSFFICTGCGRTSSSQPATCPRCGGTDFVLKTYKPQQY